MTVFPLSVTLIGQGATNPAIPNHDTTGALTIRNDNLVYTSGQWVYAIPLQQIDSCVYNEATEFMGDSWRAVVTIMLVMASFFLCFGLIIIPLVWFFWWEYTAVEVQLLIKAWDERYGLTSFTTFSLGNKRAFRETGRAAVKEIWRVRGTVRGRQLSRSTPINRQIKS